MANAQTRWDTDYEWKVVALLALGFGLVGLDRWIIASLFPTMLPELGLGPADGQRLIGALGLSWGFFAIFSGRLGDKLGHRMMILPAIFLFSAASFLSGLATGFLSLVLIRVLMGVTEGAYTPTSFAAVAAAAEPGRRGFLQGLQQSGFALFGLFGAPLVAGALLGIVPSWRYVLWIVAIPGFIIGVLLVMVLREPKNTMGGRIMEAAANAHGAIDGKWGDVLKQRNLVLCMLALAGAMACVFVLGGVLPDYLVGAVGLTQPQALTVASGLGAGGFFGQFGVPGLSDRFGRRTMAVISFIGAAIAVYYFSTMDGSSIIALWLVLAVTSFFALGNVALITGPIATESAPPGLMAAGIGMVVGAGEIFGGGIAPLIAGAVIEGSGLPAVMYVAFGGALFGIVASIFLKETAPRKLQPQQSAGGRVAAPAAAGH
ncbi:MAG: MFS transporter [Acidobacteria bacterium]|nr:MFS transporter [Acidobacteriota bacterium]